MCGIAGFISMAGATPPEEQRKNVLARMSRALVRRGPDEEAFYDDGRLSFVFRRLAIVDLDSGSQPIWNHDETVFVSVNGEIYNHQELRNDCLSDCSFRTHSDSEVVLHLYLKFGLEGIAQLNGMFAFVIYDTRSGEVVLGRDRLGIKPLYVAQFNGGVLFGSELKALLMHPECPRELNWPDLEPWGSQQKKDVSTYVTGVRHLPPGTCMVLDADGGYSSHEFWRFSDHVRHEADSFDSTTYQQEFGQLLADATVKRLMSDVPVGLYLSGGIDSSLLAALAAKENPHLHCFTVVENTTVASGDAPAAVEVAHELGLPLHAAHFSIDEICDRFTLRDLERLVAMIESPRFDPEWLLKSELHKFARQQVPELKVILLGQGADEFTGGYSNRAGSSHDNWDEYLNQEVAEDVRFWFGQERAISDDLRADLNIKHFSEGLGAKVNDYHAKMELHMYQMQHFNLWHEDRSSSFYSLEARVPFLDHRLVESLASVPDSAHETLFWDKAIVRNTLTAVMPDYPIDRPKVPFVATEHFSTMDDMALRLSLKIYPAFRMLYQATNAEPLLDTVKLDDLHDQIVSGGLERYERAWKLMTMMSLAIFERLCSEPDMYLDLVEEAEPSAPRALSEEELGNLDQLYAEPVSPQEAWTLEATIRVPSTRILLSSLKEGESTTELFLVEEGKVIRQLSIPNVDYWVVEMLEQMSNEGEKEKSVKQWSDSLDLDPQQLVNALEYLRQTGFVEKVA